MRNLPKFESYRKCRMLLQRIIIDVRKYGAGAIGIETRDPPIRILAAARTTQPRAPAHSDGLERFSSRASRLRPVPYVRTCWLAARPTLDLLPHLANLTRLTSSRNPRDRIVSGLHQTIAQGAIERCRRRHPEPCGLYRVARTSLHCSYQDSTRLGNTRRGPNLLGSTQTSLPPFLTTT